MDQDEHSGGQRGGPSPKFLPIKGIPSRREETKHTFQKRGSGIPAAAEDSRPRRLHSFAGNRKSLFQLEESFVAHLVCVLRGDCALAAPERGARRRVHRHAESTGARPEGLLRAAPRECLVAPAAGRAPDAAAPRDVRQESKCYDFLTHTLSRREG